MHSFAIYLQLIYIYQPIVGNITYQFNWSKIHKFCEQTYSCGLLRAISFMEFQFYYSGFSPLVLYCGALLLLLLMLLKDHYCVTSDLEGQFCQLFQRLRPGKPEIMEGRKETLARWLAFVQKAILFSCTVISAGVSDEDEGAWGWRRKFYGLSRIQLTSQAMRTNKRWEREKGQTRHSKVKRKSR